MDTISSNILLIGLLFIIIIKLNTNSYVMCNNLNLNEMILKDNNNNEDNINNNDNVKKNSFQDNGILRDSRYYHNNNNNNNKNNKQILSLKQKQLSQIQKEKLTFLPSTSRPLLPVQLQLKDTFLISDINEQKKHEQINEINTKMNKNDNDNMNDDNNKNNLNMNNNIDNNDNDELSSLSLNDQVKLLSKQLNALMIRRREDYKILENNLRKSLNKNLITNDDYSIDANMDIKAELKQLRHEIKILRENNDNDMKTNKERLTVEWLTQSIAEMRKELTELQEIASNVSADLNRRNQHYEDLLIIKNDYEQFKLELEAIKQRQETNEITIRDLKDESIQKEEDLKKMIRHQFNISMNNNNDNDNDNGKNINDYLIMTDTTDSANHRMRHQRFLRQQIHDLELSQHNLKRQLNELQYHKINDRVHILEIEQRRLANANFNLSRQIVGLDKLHSSMLELLEDVEGVQNKMDKTIPDIKREISKFEFTSAQLNSEQNLLREECHNIAKSLRAMAVSISALQDERDINKDLQNSIKSIQKDIEKLKSISTIQKSIVQHHIQKIEAEVNPDLKSKHIVSNEVKIDNNTSQTASNLVQQLESVELQYESIINKLPSDCSQVDQKISGVYLIAPTGQHRPILAHCTEGGWTTIQRRYDGSIDFNRSWEIYAKGFGSPSGEFWMGNEAIHHLTSDNCTQLKIKMEDIYDNVWEATYNYFYVSSREDGYRLHVSNYNGNASDALDYQNHMQFSAIDVDRDISNTHCAANYEGGWWFSHCQHANLNGRYNLGLTWFDGARNEWIAVKSSQMMVNKRHSCYSNSPQTIELATTTITSVV